MGRPRLRVGEHGETHVWQRADGRFQARVQVRDGDGRLRQVAATGATKGAAKRALLTRLDSRRDPSLTGVTADMTVEELAAYWLAHRATHGKARGGGGLAPQTLASYDDAVRGVVVPTLGALRLHDLTVGVLDAALARVEGGADGGRSRTGTPGRSTAQARSVLKQMLDLAVRHGALVGNPMSAVEPSSRAPRQGKELHHLTVAQARRLRQVVRREAMRKPGRRMPNRDLEEWVDFVLGTGCRDGEALAVRWADLDLDSAIPTVHVRGTVVEPRGTYVTTLHRQDVTKTRSDRTLILPDHVAAMLKGRRSRVRWVRQEDPVFATATGHWMSPANIRARLRRAVADCEELRGTSPHSLRRAVGTLVTHVAGLDAARDQLGHSDPSVTFQHYVGRRPIAPDLRPVLNAFFEPSPPASDENCE